ncbi:MAG: hypothetical protein AAFP84_17240 [Actinomycetota bacterium]
MDSRAAVRAVVPARAALAGNPSDGFGGAVVAVPVPVFAATVEVALDVGSTAGSTIGAVNPTAGETSSDASGLRHLVDVTVEYLVQRQAMPAELAERATIAVHTTIPRSVGLAGSSAIVLGVIDALRAADTDARWTTDLTDPTVRSFAALEVETQGLGIAAGLQDRLVQSHGRPALMDFGADAPRVPGSDGALRARTTPLPAPPGQWLLAHRTTASAPSGVVHGPLAQRADRIAAEMAALGSAALDAARAIERGSIAELGEAMDRTFALRAELLDLAPPHVEMVQAARAVGAHANYTGSGGAVIVLCRDSRVLRAATAALSVLEDCVVTDDPFGAHAG